LSKTHSLTFFSFVSTTALLLFQSLIRGLPAIAILSPEMNEASLLARKATALETSSGSPNLVTPLG